MKIVIALDSFKGSVSSLEAGQAVQAAVHEQLPAAEALLYPLADGGEGTVDAMTAGLGGEIIPVEVTGPLGKMIMSRYGKVDGGHTAVIEMADAAGLMLVPEAERNPLHTTTFGLGELILAAAKAGCRNFIIGIGGSATNDCGLGMLTALGLVCRDAAGNPVGRTGGSLGHIAVIERAGMAAVLRECTFHIACDVTNPLCGENGCSAVYGPQKGAAPAVVHEMDDAIKRFASLAEKQLGVQGADLPGAGAAGGLGYAFHAFLGGQLEPGVPLILEAIGIERDLQDADVLITGEGCIDRQTAMGKAPVGVAKLAKRVNPSIRTIALCGCAAAGAESVNDEGIDAFFPILHEALPLAQAMQKEKARQNISRTARQILRLLI
jgi:glycerate kinase